MTRSRKGRARDARSAPSASASSDRRDAAPEWRLREGRGVGGDLIVGVIAGSGRRWRSVADGEVGGDADSRRRMSSRRPEGLAAAALRRARTAIAMRAQTCRRCELAAREPRGCALQERRRRSGARRAFLLGPGARRGVVLSDPTAARLCATAPRELRLVSAILAARGHRALAPRRDVPKNEREKTLAYQHTSSPSRIWLDATVSHWAAQNALCCLDSGIPGPCCEGFARNAARGIRSIQHSSTPRPTRWPSARRP